MIQKNFGRKNYFEKFEKFNEKSLVNDLLLHVAAGRVGGAGPPSCKTWPQEAALGHHQRGPGYLSSARQLPTMSTGGSTASSNQVLNTFPWHDII
jgi:hypothetical protein